MSSFAIVSSFVSAAAKLHYELSFEIQKYRLQCGRIYEIMENFTRIHTIACRRQEGKLGGWEIIGNCCLRRMGCGRIFGHMRFEALKSRSFPIVDAYSSWIRWHLFAFGGGSHVFFVLLKQKIDAFRVVQNRQNR